LQGTVCESARDPPLSRPTGTKFEQAGWLFFQLRASPGPSCSVCASVAARVASTSSPLPGNREPHLAHPGPLGGGPVQIGCVALLHIYCMKKVQKKQGRELIYSQILDYQIQTICILYLHARICIRCIPSTPGVHCGVQKR
jgi:hypothetical protein